jgi:phage tail sheath protein FI
MPLNLASPGIVVREIDLTTGRSIPSVEKIGAIVAPFAKGPVNVPTLINNERELLENFGEPYQTDNHYEHWMVASSYLSYGGKLRVVRAGDNALANGIIGTASTLRIDSLDDYNAKGYDETTVSDVVIAARNPGSWANGVRVAIIDSKADQILTGISTANVTVGLGITQAISSILPGAGTTSVLTGYLKGIVTGIGVSSIEVKVLSHVSSGNTETQVDYQQSGVYAFSGTATVSIGTGVGLGTTAIGTSESDWFNSQSIGINSTSSVLWSNLAQRPGTSAYAATRNSRFDEVHVVVIDALGTITGNAGAVLEKHLNLSKATNAEYSVGSTAYWRKYIAENSKYIFGLGQPVGLVTTGFSSGFTQVTATNGNWNQKTEGTTFSAIGSYVNDFSKGANYTGISTITTTGALTASLTKLTEGYELFESTENYKVDFLLMGSASYSISQAQALANKLISVAEIRKDAIAFISPYRGSALSASGTQESVRSASDITDRVIQFYSPITSSSYAVFDSGYKYVFDRFASTFRYVPLNGDIAGLCARTDINNFPWYSPAGTTRGSILSAIKLAYNPTQSQRDRLYSARVNPVVFSPGSGVILFGDKTGLSRVSAFDRINVRRLFIYLENFITQVAKDALFEFNDEVTRTTFVNTIEPFLRDVQAKRGVQDYVVICDETNNTAAVIDNNEFIADIYIKPARSINFIGLNFIATRTGVDFAEVIGNF